jgi:hypothetical protein
MEDGGMSDLRVLWATQGSKGNAPADTWMCPYWASNEYMNPLI